MNPFKRALHSRLPRSDAFRRALRLNTAIVAVIVLCLGILSVQLRAMMKKNVEDNCCLTLEYDLTQLSAQLQSVTSCVIDFRELLAEQSPNGLRFSDAVSLNAARTALRRIVISNPLVGEIAYVCEDSGLVITTQSIFYNIDSFLSTYEFAGMDTSIFCDYLGEERLATVRFLPCDALDSRYPISFDTAFCCAIPLDTERYIRPKASPLSSCVWTRSPTSSCRPPFSPTPSSSCTTIASAAATRCCFRAAFPTTSPASRPS